MLSLTFIRWWDRLTWVLVATKHASITVTCKHKFCSKDLFSQGRIKYKPKSRCCKPELAQAFNLFLYIVHKVRTCRVYFLKVWQSQFWVIFDLEGKCGDPHGGWGEEAEDWSEENSHGKSLIEVWKWDEDDNYWLGNCTGAVTGTGAWLAYPCYHLRGLL